jgi:hypothetical protein
LLFDAGAAYSIFMTAGFLALGPDFFGRVPLVFLLDFLSIYFTFGVLFDVVTLTSVLITTARLGTTPLAFYDGAYLCGLLGRRQLSGPIPRSLRVWWRAAVECCVCALKPRPGGRVRAPRAKGSPADTSYKLELELDLVHTTSNTNITLCLLLCCFCTVPCSREGDCCSTGQPS